MSASMSRKLGFTLLEVSIALTILVVATVGLGSAIHSSGQLSEDARDYERVLAVAREELELARTLPLDEVMERLVGDVSGVRLEYGPVSGRFIVPGLRGTTDDAASALAPGTITLSLFEVESIDPRSRMIQIEVICRWNGTNGSARSARLCGVRRR